MYGKFTYEGGEFTMYYDPQMGQFDNREPIQGDPRAQQVINSLPDEYFTNDEKETVISGIIDMILENANTQTEEKNPDGHHHTSNEPFIDPSGPQDDGAYANYVTYVGPNGEELGTEDYDGELEPDMMAQMASDEECKMLCDKHNIDYNDTIGCLKFDDGEATMQDGEELPDGTIAFYGGKDESVEVEEGKLPAGLQAYQDKKNGKKDDDADKDEDKEVDEDKDEEVDENAQFESSLAQLKKLSGI